MFGGIVVLASVLMTTWSFCLGRCKGKCVLALYTIMALVVVLVFLFISYLFLMLGLNGQEWIESSCERALNGDMEGVSSEERGMIDKLSEADETLYKLMNSNMCTTYCSCFQGKGGLKTYN